MKKLTIKRVALVSIMSALSAVLYIFIKFPLPIFPSFLEINFSMLPILICTFALGPIDGLFAVLIRLLVKLIISSTHTAGVGEIADLILGTSVVLASGFTYKYLKIKNKDIIALLVGIIIWVMTGILLNLFYSVPAYIQLYFGGNTEAFIGLCSMIPGIDSTNYMMKYILYAVIPFNAIISISVVLVTFLVHKRIRVLYDYI